MIHINKIIITGISLFMINALHGMDKDIFNPNTILTYEKYISLRNLPGKPCKNSGITHITVGFSDAELAEEEKTLQKREMIKSYSIYGLGGGAAGIGLYTFFKLYTHQELNLKEMVFSGLVGGATGLTVKSCDTDSLPSKISQPKFRQMPLLRENE